MDPSLKAKLEPEDMLQEVYLEVFRQANRFEHRGPNSFLDWVITIADRKLIDAWRMLHRKGRDVRREVPACGVRASGSFLNFLDRVYADSHTPSRVVRHDEAVAALMACMPSLSESHRRVLQLRVLEGLEVSEVAKRLGKSPAAVVALTKRALSALRGAVDQLGEFTRGA